MEKDTVYLSCKIKTTSNSPGEKSMSSPECQCQCGDLTSLIELVENSLYLIIGALSAIILIFIDLRSIKKKWGITVTVKEGENKGSRSSSVLIFCRCREAKLCRKHREVDLQTAAHTQHDVLTAMSKCQASHRCTNPVFCQPVVYLLFNL